MNMKLLGAILVVVACGAVGFAFAASHLREERALRNLIMILDHMECELQYRLPPLPELCRQVSMEDDSLVHKAFLYLAEELDSQVSPDVCRCMTAALEKNKELPLKTNKAMLMLGHSLGRFDLDGQLKGIDFVRQQCRIDLEKLSLNKDSRLRGYRTLGICAGIAVAILFV